MHIYATTKPLLKVEMQQPIAQNTPDKRKHPKYEEIMFKLSKSYTIFINPQKGIVVHNKIKQKHQADKNLPKTTEV